MPPGAWQEDFCALRDQAWSYADAGHYKAACRILEPVLVGVSERSYPDDAAMAELENLMGYVLYKMGQFRSAHEHHRSALLFFERPEASAPNELRWTLRSLAETSRHMGNLVAAAAMQQRVVELDKEAMGVGAIETLRSQSLLADIWREAGRFIEARDVHLAALLAATVADAELDVRLHLKLHVIRDCVDLEDWSLGASLALELINDSNDLPPSHELARFARRWGPIIRPALTSVSQDLTPKEVRAIRRALLLVVK